MSSIIPRSVSLALARHGSRGDLACEYDGSFASALLVHCHERTCDGISPPSIRGMFLYPGAAILRLADPVLRLDDLDVGGLRGIVSRSLDAGFSPRTIKGKHLQLARVLLQRFGLPDHIGEVKRRMRSRLGGQYVPPPRLTPGDLASIFERISQYPGTLPARRSDLALIRLLALRAVRTFELCRVRIERDVSRDGTRLVIREPKCIGHPRAIQLSATLADDLRHLCAGRTSGPLIHGGPRHVNARLETWKRRLDEPRLNQRHLRRSCASSLSYQGAPLPVIRQTLGHAQGSPQTMRYLCDDEDRLRSELNRLEHLSDPRAHSPESSDPLRARP